GSRLTCSRKPIRRTRKGSTHCCGTTVRLTAPTVTTEGLALRTTRVTGVSIFGRSWLRGASTATLLPAASALPAITVGAFCHSSLPEIPTPSPNPRKNRGLKAFEILCLTVRTLPSIHVWEHAFAKSLPQL